MIDENWVLNRILSGLAGAFGASAVSVLWQPKQIREKSALLRGIVIGGVGVGFSLSFTGWALRVTGLDGSNVDNLLAVSAIEGGVSLAVLMWLTNFFKNREDKDLIEVVSEVRGKNSTPTSISNSIQMEEPHEPS